MKRFWITLISMVVTYSGLLAQDNLPSKGDISILVKVGMTGALMVGDDINSDDMERKPALLVGGNLDYYISPFWSFRTGVLYEQRNYQSVMLGSTQRATYLTVPITLNAHPGKNKRWNINLGPALGINLSNDLTGAGEDQKLAIHQVDPGMELGTGLKIPMGKSFLYGEVNSLIGFINPVKDSNLDARWTRVSINVGFVF